MGYMFSYIDLLCALFFPIGLIKTKSELLVSWHWQWTLAEVEISVDAYLFVVSQGWPVTLRIEEWVFSGCTVLPDSKESKFGSSDKEYFSSAGEITKAVLVQ